MFKNSYIVIVMVCLSACVPIRKSMADKQQLTVLIDSLHQADQACVEIQPADSAAAAFLRVKKSNYPFIADIFKRYGYPGYDFIGTTTSDKYFVLVQHSDFNVDFQQEVLQKMKKEVAKQNASGQNFAFLSDRIEINNGRPQIYGTQVNMSGNTTIKSCIDTANLDIRRKSVGLEPIQDYINQCNEVFYMLNPQENVR